MLSDITSTLTTVKTYFVGSFLRKCSIILSSSVNDRRALESTVQPITRLYCACCINQITNSHFSSTAYMSGEQVSGCSNLTPL